MRLAGRRIHIAGSADPSTNHRLLSYAHKVVSDFTFDLAKAGATFVAQVGKEPRAKAGSTVAPAITFDWTILEVLGDLLESGSIEAAGQGGRLLACVTTRKTEDQVPSKRRQLWARLLAANAVMVEHIEGDWTSGAVRRERQAQLGDVLVAISGSEGVEHLAQLYAGHGKPVIPLDLDLGSSTSNGTSGAAKLNKIALANPDQFLALKDRTAGAARLTEAATRQGKVAAAKVVAALMQVVADLRDPSAFYVRLLNPKVRGFIGVERFFRNVVDPVVHDLGYAKAEMGDIEVQDAFMNVEIFDRIHHAGLVVADLTGVRPNCLMELGYALGRLKHVVLTARSGTHLPFDPGAIDTYFWDSNVSDLERAAELRRYHARTSMRPPVVRLRGWLPG
jgi:TIR- and PNP-associating SLOG family